MSKAAYRALKTCKFCGAEIEPGKGWMYVLADGTIWYFCSSKCAKNMLHLGRKPERVRWTAKARELKQKRRLGQNV
ncbi:MAG: 50S ribosomal protein L24e [Candidatus Korarchaeota archaeon]|nr:50S ribosomal protein L24e [Candidatus Korarchaeota archaeon]